MDIKTYDNLNETDKNALYEYLSKFDISNIIQDYEAMTKYCGGIIFDNGSNFYIIYENKEIKGTLGMVTRELERKSELFITALYIKKENLNYCSKLLEYVLKLCEKYSNVKIMLGIKSQASYLDSKIKENDFIEKYKHLNMKYTGLFKDNSEDISCEYVDKSNIKIFQTINNEAFLKSPNGSWIEDSELDELVEDFGKQPQNAAIAYYNDEPVGIYTLSNKDSIGWIESIGIKPSLQGKGIGRKLLQKAIIALHRQSPTSIKLSVISSNTNAVKLYKSEGFVLESEMSTWYEKLT